MSDFYQHAIAVFMGFFAVMNPIANTAVFVGMTSERTGAERVRIAVKALLVTFAIVASFALLGKAIFHIFGITLPALQIAGGVLVFMIGYSMVQGDRSRMHHPAADRGTNAMPEQGADDDIAISPLALPILAGPGTLATAMNYSADGGWSNVGVTIAAFAVLCGITFACFLMGERLVRVIGDSGVQIVTRLMGLILAVIGAQMLIEGVRGAVAG